MINLDFKIYMSLESLKIVVNYVQLMLNMSSNLDISVNHSLNYAN